LYQALARWRRTRCVNGAKRCRLVGNGRQPLCRLPVLEKPEVNQHDQQAIASVITRRTEFVPTENSKEISGRFRHLVSQGRAILSSGHFDADRAPAVSNTGGLARRFTPMSSEHVAALSLVSTFKTLPATVVSNRSGVCRTHCCASRSQSAGLPRRRLGSPRSRVGTGVMSTFISALPLDSPVESLTLNWNWR